ncbi:MAG: hypothetical protein QXK37_00885 [Candidatus Woesearchaeota archaeon]
MQNDMQNEVENKIKNRGANNKIREVKEVTKDDSEEQNIIV